LSEDRDVAHDPAALELSWDDSHRGAMALLPTGPVWPRDPAGVLSRTVRGLSGVHWRAWRRVRAMLAEADPRSIYETLRMWEIDCGLPDPCLENPPTTIEGRRAAVIAKRQRGATTRPADFIRLAAILGYEIEIVEFRPMRTWSSCTDALNPDQVIAAPGAEPRSIGWPHTWLVRVLNFDLSIRWMRCDGGCTEFLREWARGEIECVFERIKPAQTLIIFSYPPPTP
jgi:uncharacterized protein YmfQ (DUF2313 family)